ncbi:uncharacterized protein LOC127869776 [Dreissena polymorpha]|uniref:uncharacterized protein LOC127869776 n=1 Tax=Dreissena polymorpha TaxID=45954 RepID=UPI002264F662|nr:uncharacterized protein LOC127869776 [Dreissena polymorpha]
MFLIGAQLNMEIICNKNSTTVYFEDANNKLVEVKRNASTCIIHGMQNMPNLQCGCKIDSRAACNMSSNEKEHGCHKLRCYGSKDGVASYSKFVEVCLSGNQIAHANVAAVNCSDVKLTPEVMYWTVEDTAFMGNGYKIMITKFDLFNISVINDLITKEENRSMAVCKLEENNSKEWSITLIFLRTACVAEKLFKQSSSSLINRSCPTSKGNPAITRKLEEYSDPECPSVNIKSTVNVSFCDAVNRDDMGARQFVGNNIGSFKLELLSEYVCFL